jgi:hypothetical protein
MNIHVQFGFNHICSFPLGPMLIYFLRWWPSWISDRYKKQKLGKGHSNDHLFTVWVQSVH